MLILGTHCDSDKALNWSLQAIYGVKSSCALKICAVAGINPFVKLKKLSSSRLEAIRRICREELRTDLLRNMLFNKKALIEIKHYKGVRHMFGLPARGQRTRTNASTSKRLFTKDKRLFRKTSIK